MLAALCHHVQVNVGSVACVRVCACLWGVFVHLCLQISVVWPAVAWPGSALEAAIGAGCCSSVAQDGVVQLESSTPFAP
jgi:hypothetical protein